jgi:hypothetical protein
MEFFLFSVWCGEKLSRRGREDRCPPV